MIRPDERSARSAAFRSGLILRLGSITELRKTSSLRPDRSLHPVSLDIGDVPVVRRTVLLVVSVYELDRGLYIQTSPSATRAAHTCPCREVLQALQEIGLI